MAIDRAKEGRKKAKKLREASLEKSKGGIGRFFKGVKKAIKKDVAKQKEASLARLTPKQRALKKKTAKQRTEKKAGKTWTKAVKAQKKTGGPTMTELIKRRNAAKKGSAAYASAQNAINEAYGSKKVHKAEAPKKAAAKPAPKKPDYKTPLTESEKRETVDVGGSPASEEIGQSEERKYAGGGKVESNPYGWPSRDARNGGK
jgi:hypothetical protein